MADLQHWLNDKLVAKQYEAERLGEPIPVRLAGNTPVFRVPTELVKILDRDLVMAGIAKRLKDGRIDKRDERGRTIDVHALRTTFGTHLSKGGVPLRTAQAAMRHSDPKLTANVYTDPKLLDVADALKSLPVLPLSERRMAEAQAATGTERSSLVPVLVPKPASVVQASQVLTEIIRNSRRPN